MPNEGNLQVIVSQRVATQMGSMLIDNIQLQARLEMLEKQLAARAKEEAPSGETPAAAAHA